MSNEHVVTLKGTCAVLPKDKTGVSQVKLQMPICLQRLEFNTAAVGSEGCLLLSLPGLKVFSAPKDTLEP